MCSGAISDITLTGTYEKRARDGTPTRAHGRHPSRIEGQTNALSVHPHFPRAGGASAAAREHVGSHSLDELPGVVGKHVRAVDLVGVEVIARALEVTLSDHRDGSEARRGTPSNSDRDVGSALGFGLEETIAARVANLAHADLKVFGFFEVDGENGVTAVISCSTSNDVVQPAFDSQLGGGDDGARRVARRNANERARCGLRVCRASQSGDGERRRKAGQNWRDAHRCSPDRLSIVCNTRRWGN